MKRDKKWLQLCIASGEIIINTNKFCNSFNPCIISVTISLYFVLMWPLYFSSHKSDSGSSINKKKKQREKKL